MKSSDKQILMAFLIPLMLAGVSLYIFNFMWKVGREECGRAIDFFGDIECASTNIQFLYEFFGYLTWGFVLLSIILPCVLDIRRQPVEQIRIFD
ncbi:MAG: hypothetical protein LH614_17030 [Pyrinomonadaceae bacterium]|nr:hypothetical protein [Pyrinomonadaceae bacterium]